jgi:hypothetical protein
MFTYIMLPFDIPAKHEQYICQLFEILGYDTEVYARYC